MAVLPKAERERIAAGALAELARVNEEFASAEEINDMGLDALRSYLADHGVELNEEVIDAQIQTTLGPLSVHLDRGGELDEETLQDLQKRVERAVEQTARSVARMTMRKLREAAFAEGDDRDPSERYLMWIAILSGSCRGCESRHRTVFSADYWEDNGPGDGGTPCAANCRCSLVPVENPGEGNEGLKV